MAFSSRRLATLPRPRRFVELPTAPSPAIRLCARHDAALVAATRANVQQAVPPELSSPSRKAVTDIYWLPTGVGSVAAHFARRDCAGACIRTAAEQRTGPPRVSLAPGASEPCVNTQTGHINRRSPCAGTGGGQKLIAPLAPLVNLSRVPLPEPVQSFHLSLLIPLIWLRFRTRSILACNSCVSRGRATRGCELPWLRVRSTCTLGSASIDRKRRTRLRKFMPSNYSSRSSAPLVMA